MTPAEAAEDLADHVEQFLDHPSRRSRDDLDAALHAYREATT